MISEDALAALGEDCWLIVHAANNFSSGSRSPRRTARSTSTHSIPRAARQHARLRLDQLRGEHAAALGERRIEPDPLEIPGQLLDGLDSGDPLDLDRDPRLLGVPAHEVDRPDIGRPLAAHEPQSLAAPVRLLGEQLLQMRLDPVLGERDVLVRRAHIVDDVARHLGELDLEPVLGLARALAHDHLGGRALNLLDHRRRRHPVERLVATGVGVDQDRAVGLDHDQPQRLGQQRVEAAGVADLAAGDDQAHEASKPTPSLRRNRCGTIPAVQATTAEYVVTLDALKSNPKGAHLIVQFAS